MFEIDRTFSCRNPRTGVMDWFFSAREGIYGPYTSKAQATKYLKEFMNQLHLCLSLQDYCF